MLEGRWTKRLRGAGRKRKAKPVVLLPRLRNQSLSLVGTQTPKPLTLTASPHRRHTPIRIALLEQRLVSVLQRQASSQEDRLQRLEQRLCRKRRHQPSTGHR